MKPKSDPIHIPHFEIKDGRYFDGARCVSNFILSITRIERCGAPGKKFGTLTRYVRFSPGGDEFEIPVKAMVTPAGFRSFCLSRGNYMWSGGQNDLDRLIQDLDSGYQQKKS